MRVAINGFGRIGRQVFKAGFHRKGFTIVAINDLVDIDTLAYLLKYDSVYGIWEEDVKVKDGALWIGRRKINVFSEKDPANLPWKKLKVDTVIESTGIFRTKKQVQSHLDAGAKRILISSPAKDDSQTIVLGANEGSLSKADKTVLSNASCTTNATAPLIAALAPIGVKKAMLTTIHGYTAGQSLVDAPRKDLRRGRAAAQNIVPTSTGAAIATTKAIPSLAGKFDGIAVRVPVITGSLVDITFIAGKKTTVKAVNALLKKASKKRSLQGIFTFTEDPIVSTDIIGDPHSSIADLSMTRVVDGNLVKVVAWYDNEWAYSNRLVDVTLLKL